MSDADRPPELPDTDEHEFPTKRGQWHAVRAAYLLQEWDSDPQMVAKAQVHATLALAWATADRWGTS